MPLTLWHTTPQGAVPSILEHGFRGDQCGLVYFTPPPQAWLHWEDTEAVLEVVLDLTEEELEARVPASVCRDDYGVEMYKIPASGGALRILHSRETQPLLQRPDVVRQTRGH